MARREYEGSAFVPPDHGVRRTSRKQMFLDEAQRPGHQCGTFNYPCLPHGSMHCLACCVSEPVHG